MFFLIPTAKEMAQAHKHIPCSLPVKVKTIVETMAKLSPSELEKLYHINPKASQKEYQRWQNFTTDDMKCDSAIAIYNGLMYRNLKQEPFTSADCDYLAQNLRITSSLYGIISPFEMISEHRLDFNTPITIEGHNLKNYWRSDYDCFLQENTSVISLLSSEFEAVFSPHLRQKLIKIQFFEKHQNKLKTHSSISKKARGQFLFHAMRQNCQSLRSLKQLSWNGFSYQENLSTEQKLVFIKLR